MCDSCERSKATKHYNRAPQQRAERAYQFIHTDLVGPITPISFGAEGYFFTFTDDYTRITGTYNAKRKSEWLKSLKEFHNLVRTRSGLDRPIQRLRSDYWSELQSREVDKWLTEQGITFEPSAPYSQEENGVSERTGRTIMDIVQTTILEGGIDDTLWPEIVLAMTHVKNLRPTRALKDSISPIEMQDQALPDLQHLRILGSNVYVFLHEEERSLKSAKWEASALRGKLAGFDGHKIYRSTSRTKTKSYGSKTYESTKTSPPRQQRPFQTSTESQLSMVYKFQMSNSRLTKTAPPKRRQTRKKSLPNLTKAAPPKRRQTRRKHPSDESSASEEETNAQKSPPKKQTTTRAGRTIKPTPKSKTNGRDKDIKALITHLASLLDKDWEENDKVTAFPASCCNNSEDPGAEVDSEIDPLHILASVIHKADAEDASEFAMSTQLDVEEAETYERAMNGPHAQQWAHAIQEELDQLEKNETWKLVPESSIEPGHRPLSGKWVFKVKRDVNGAVARFKARWVVRGYLQQLGIDFDQTFAAVVKPMAFRVLFAIAAYYDLDIDQMDVKTAFLYGLLDQLVYVQMPKGSETAATKGMVCKLLKALYGLKQAPRLGYERLSQFLSKN